ncbi:hypothetical protein B1690_17130 [Geobacillus sp. 46C-IIa]|uniref:copper resistance protein CopC n=1 Tax=Geobacillus sp. 46C-IIa TaxID=1963025 RepID=UPI0009BCBBA3|nr:copper resistance protein CopC [Geobacillus sp. 46C-IIa]OQP03890.1 hypothetical protein B1690_17130 [Geobacillus sp. 46C-IIa]QNU27230.1 copper resistance protein CopC [Geobacillus sp. 46C-IIa]
MPFLRSFITCIGMLIILFFIIPGTSSFAHSSLEKTFPKDGERLNQSPPSIEVWFQDPVVIHPESIKLADETGNPIQIEKPIVDPKDKTHVISRINNDLPAGNYVANINVISLDGDVMKENLMFQVIGEGNKNKKKETLKIVDFLPDDGEIVHESPKKIDLWFNMPAEITAIGVFDDRQQSVMVKEPIIDPKDPTHVMVYFGEELSSGTYQVTWYARPSKTFDNSEPDILDVFYFAVDKFTPIQQGNKGVPTKSLWFQNIGLKQWGYWILFIGLTTLFGGTFFNSVILKENDSKWNKISLALIILVLIGEGIIVISQKVETGNLSMIHFLSLKFVWIPVIQGILLVLGLLFDKIRLFFYGMALLLLPAVIGHASYPRYGGYLTIGVNVLHLLTSSIWIGGLFGLITIPKKENMKDRLKNVIPKFSKWALISFVVIIFTGLFMTKQYVPSFTIKNFIQSEWGKGVVFKIVATFFVLGLGYLQRRSIKNLTSKAVNKVIYRARVEWIYGVFILFFASILVVSAPSAAEQGIYPSSVEKEKVKLDVNISPLYPGLNVLTMNFNNKDIEKVEVTLSMLPNYNVTYNAFKVDKGVFKLTGNLLHATGTMNMNVKAKKFNGESVEFSFKIVIPGEMRLGES